MLTPLERKVALQVTPAQIMSTSAEILSCLGCSDRTGSLSRATLYAKKEPSYLRPSGLMLIERAEKQAYKNTYEEYEKHANSNENDHKAIISVQKRYLDDPTGLLGLFTIQDQWAAAKSVSTLSEQCHGRKNKTVCKSTSNCFLHTPRQRTAPSPTAFLLMWNKLSAHEKACTSRVDAEDFLVDLQGFLKKHRFCCRCKEKVLEAYDILLNDVHSDCLEEEEEDVQEGECEACKLGEDCQEECCHIEEISTNDMSRYHDDQSDDDYESTMHHHLFDEISYCQNSGNVIVPCTLNFYMQLMYRAKNPEGVGEYGNAHARTLGEAQDEVLICLGIVIYEHITEMWTVAQSATRAEELLVYVSTFCLRTNLNEAIERLHGEELMAQLVAEEKEDEERLVRKKEKKKEKKKKRKQSKVKGLEVDGVSNVSVVASPVSLSNQNGVLSNDTENQVVAVTEKATTMAAVRAPDLDEDAELLLLSSMGWSNDNGDDTPEDECDEDTSISQEEMRYWKENQQKVESARQKQRLHLQAQFNALLFK